MTSPSSAFARVTQPVFVTAGAARLAGDLAVPRHAHGLVVFAHGSGSSRFSPRNRYVADALDRRDLATLLVDLLTEQEEAIDERTGELRFDVELLGQRLAAVVSWSHERPELRRLPLGLFGASTGAGAALLAAADQPLVRAVVSRGGRPDLAGPALARVAAPTLLIVGGLDRTVIELNRRAADGMRGAATMRVVPGATHLFEEPGALEEVADLAAEWFDRHLDH